MASTEPAQANRCIAQTLRGVALTTTATITTVGTTEGTTARTAAKGTLQRFVYLHDASAKQVTVEGRDRALGITVRHLDESEAARPSRLSIIDHVE